MSELNHQDLVLASLGDKRWSSADIAVAEFHGIPYPGETSHDDEPEVP